MPAGRPTLYCPAILELTRLYIDNYQEHGDAIPSIAGLALILGIRRETIHVWCGEEGKEEFSNIIEQLLAKQEQVLISQGLKGTYNATITKLILTKHGYSDKQETIGEHVIEVIHGADFGD